MVWVGVDLQASVDQMNASDANVEQLITCAFHARWLCTLKPCCLEADRYVLRSGLEQLKGGKRGSSFSPGASGSAIPAPSRAGSRSANPGSGALCGAGPSFGGSSDSMGGFDPKTLIRPASADGAPPTFVSSRRAAADARWPGCLQVRWGGAEHGAEPFCEPQTPSQM